MQQLNALIDHFLAVKPYVFLKGDSKHQQQQLEKLHALVLEVWAPATAAERAAKSPHFVAKAHILLKNVLSARKRSRDWKSEHYTHAVAIACSVCVQAFDPHPSPELLDKVDAAVVEVAQILSSQLQQQQQQQLKQQEQPPQQEMSLKMVAFCLLSWGLTAEQVWHTISSSRSTTYLMHSVHLAAVFSRCCFSEKALKHGFSLYTAVANVSHMAFLVLARVGQTDSATVRTQLLSSPATMQLCLTLLLPISCLLLQQAASSGSSSGNSGSGNSGNSGSGNSGSNSSSGNSSGSSSGLEGAASRSAAAATPRQQQQQQQQQQHRALASQVWVAAGFGADTLPLWMAAAQELSRQGWLLAGFAKLDPALSGSGNSTGSPDVIRQLPPDTPQLLQSFVVLSQVFALCVRTWVPRTVAAGRNTSAWLEGGRELGREQQQLLQGVVWQLPQLLLQTALLGGGGEPLVTEVAADAAWCCTMCWRLTELQPTIAATAAASASSSSTAAVAAEKQFEGQLLPPLLECWLQLMHQQLLQPGEVLLSAIQAAAGADFLQQQQQQQHVQAPATAAAADPWDSSLPCECCPKMTGDTELLLTSGGRPCVVLDCKRCYCVSVLLDLLQPLSFNRSVEGWSGQLPAVLLLLEVLLRRVGPMCPLCSSSSSSSSSNSSSSSGGSIGGSSSSSGGGRVSRGCTLMLQSCMYACQVLVTGRKRAWGGEDDVEPPPGGVIIVMILPSATQLPPPVPQRPLQQLTAVMASFLKLCRSCGQQGGSSGALDAAWGIPVDVIDAMINGWAIHLPQVSFDELQMCPSRSFLWCVRCVWVCVSYCVLIGCVCIVSSLYVWRGSRSCFITIVLL